MKQLFILQHLLYNNSTLLLTKEGEELVRSTVQEIKGYFMPGQKVIIIYSPAPHIEESAEIAASILDAQMEEHPYYWERFTRPYTDEEMTNFLNEQSHTHEAEIVLFITNRRGITDIRLALKREYPDSYKSGRRSIHAVGNLYFVGLAPEAYTKNMNMHMEACELA